MSNKNYEYKAYGVKYLQQAEVETLNGLKVLEDNSKALSESVRYNEEKIQDLKKKLFSLRNSIDILEQRLGL